MKQAFTVIIKLSLPLFILFSFELKSQTKIIEDFESYANTESLTKVWQKSGDSSVDLQLGVLSEEKITPGGLKYLQYSYTADQNASGGILERAEGQNFFPLDLSFSKAGLQFYLKGDGTDNFVYFRFHQSNNGKEAIWRSHPISLKKVTWQIIRIPFILDPNKINGMHLFYTNGTVFETKDDLFEGLSSITKFQISLDNPNPADTNTYNIFFDEFRVVDFFPPQNGIKIADFEGYNNSTDFIVDWQGFGYGTLDYFLERNAVVPDGFKCAAWEYEPEDRTTWGMAFRSRSAFYKIPNLTSIAAGGGVQFLVKGDGTEDRFLFRFTDTENNYWGSYWMSIKDTSWQLMTVPFIVDTLKGFRWLGNDPNGTYWTSDIGTTEELRASLGKIIEVRWDKRNPVHDEVRRVLRLDALYAVNEFPALPPVEVDDFEAYTDNDNLAASWNQFGTGSVSMELITAGSKSGLKAMALSYNGVNGYTALRKRNILPGLNFSELKGGIQFWLKGDGSSNKISFRLQNGNEMWESAPVSLATQDWRHIGIQFIADSVNGFRYLGSNPDEPLWSSDVGTNEQLLGDIANIDQVRFYIRNPEALDNVRTFYIDKVEGVDKFETDVVVSVDSKNTTAAPVIFNLGQNYPNPFNPSTNITYSIPEAGLVSLKIYNIIGQEVITLINEFREAGHHQVQFNASNLVSGIYIYRIQAGSFVGSKKMILMK